MTPWTQNGIWKYLRRLDDVQDMFWMSYLRSVSVSRGTPWWRVLLWRNVPSFIKKRLQHRCFPVKFAKISRTPFFTEHLLLLLLKFIGYFVHRLLRHNGVSRIWREAAGFPENYLNLKLWRLKASNLHEGCRNKS